MEAQEKFRHFIAQQDESFRIVRTEQQLQESLFQALHQSADSLIHQYHQETTCLTPEGYYLLEEMLRTHCDHLAYNAQEIMKKYRASL